MEAKLLYDQFEKPDSEVYAPSSIAIPTPGGCSAVSNLHTWQLGVDHGVPYFNNQRRVRLRAAVHSPRTPKRLEPRLKHRRPCSIESCLSIGIRHFSAPFARSQAPQ